jgi:two-component system KDP operon response regulator KdpE
MITMSTRPLRILVVDDDPAMVGAITALVGTEGHQVITAYDGLTAVKRFREEHPDLVLLDLAMPGPDGFSVAGQMRAVGQAPILVVSGESGEAAKVRALGLGADDYLTKPFGFEELLARIRAALRRVARAASDLGAETFTCGPLRIEHAARRVFLDAEEVHLTPLEFKLLSVLAVHAGRIVTRKQLLLEVWGPHSTGETQYLRVYMTHLRRKLERGSGARIFRTEAGVGYGLECPETG